VGLLKELYLNRALIGHFFFAAPKGAVFKQLLNRAFAKGIQLKKLLEEFLFKELSESKSRASC
jgi:hypothetical protein